MNNITVFSEKEVLFNKKAHCGCYSLECVGRSASYDGEQEHDSHEEKRQYLSGSHQVQTVILKDEQESADYTDTDYI